MIRRGDVVMVDFPFTDTGTSKVRPALAGGVGTTVGRPGSDSWYGSIFVTGGH